MSTQPQRLGIGAWIVIAVLVVLLVAAAVVAFQGWTAHADVVMPTSAYVALGLGIFFSLVVGCGLMALVFYSSRKGYDENQQGMGHIPEDDT